MASTIMKLRGLVSVVLIVLLFATFFSAGDDDEGGGIHVLLADLLIVTFLVHALLSLNMFKCELKALFGLNPKKCDK